MKLTSEEQRLPKPLKLFLLQCAAYSVICSTVEFICRYLLHLGYPYGYPAVPHYAMFGDFRFWTTRFAYFHSPQVFVHSDPMMYPAPVAICYKLFLTAPGSFSHPRLATARFLIVVLVTSWIMLLQLWRALIKRGLSRKNSTLFLLATYLMSFPFWFEIHQANMEFIVWILLTLAIWGFWTEKSYTAATCVGMAASMKIFPFVFLGIFIIRKQYRQAAFSFLVWGVATVASLWALCPDIRLSWRETTYGLENFRQHYMLKLLPIESGFDHSLFCVIKRSFPVLPPPEHLGHILNLYLAIAAVGGIALFFLRIRKLPLVNQILCLSIAAILLPPASYDYTLLHLYAPFALLVFVAIEPGMQSTGAAANRGLTYSLGLFAFLLSLQSEFIFHGIRFSGQLKAAALALLWIVALIYPFPVARRPPTTVVQDSTN